MDVMSSFSGEISNAAIVAEGSVTSYVVWIFGYST